MHKLGVDPQVEKACGSSAILFVIFIDRISRLLLQVETYVNGGLSLGNGKIRSIGRSVWQLPICSEMGA